MGTGVYFFLTLLLAVFLIPLWSEMMQSLGHLQSNFRGRLIPQSMGSVFMPVFTIAAAWGLWVGILLQDTVTRVAIVVFGYGILGLMDDIWGDEKSRGFSGHFRRFLRHGEVTTGFLKAVAGFLVALWVASGLPGMFLLLFWRAVIIALSANLINLFDLRPGRSLKSFILISLILVWQVPTEKIILILFPFWLSSLVYLPLDLKGRGMLGDAGANVLGGVLGLIVVLTAPASMQIIYLAILVIIHILAERISLTRLIAANPVLHFFDKLGQESWEK